MGLEEAGRGKAVALVGNREFGKAAVEGIAGELGMVAEIFPALKAVTAAAAGMTQPGNPYQVPGVEFGDAGRRQPIRCRQSHVPESGEAWGRGAHHRQHANQSGRRRRRGPAEESGQGRGREGESPEGEGVSPGRI